MKDKNYHWIEMGLRQRGPKADGTWGLAKAAPVAIRCHEALLVAWLSGNFTICVFGRVQSKDQTWQASPRAVQNVFFSL